MSHKFALIFRLTFPWFSGSEEEFLAAAAANPEVEGEEQVAIMRKEALSQAYPSDEEHSADLGGAEAQFLQAMSLIGHAVNKWPTYKMPFSEKWQLWRTEVCKDSWSRKDCTESGYILCGCWRPMCGDSNKMYAVGQGFIVRPRSSLPS